ncbi:MAG: hypothetical protein ACUZ77_07480 [Candidatus Brocadiales bacterium]
MARWRPKTPTIPIPTCSPAGDSISKQGFTTTTQDNIIKPYPKACPEGPIGDSEESYGDAHEAVGYGLGFVGIDETSALTVMEVWEIIEPGIWTGWGAWGVYQGRDNFEGGEEGIEEDIRRGMEGYERGRRRRRR